MIEYTNSRTSNSLSHQGFIFQHLKQSFSIFGGFHSSNRGKRCLFPFDIDIFVLVPCFPGIFLITLFNLVFVLLETLSLTGMFVRIFSYIIQFLNTRLRQKYLSAIFYLLGFIDYRPSTPSHIRNFLTGTIHIPPRRFINMIGYHVKLKLTRSCSFSSPLSQNSYLPIFLIIS